MSENDATVDAEHLIKTVARAFYDDTAIAIIDVLINDKFLRDDQDMGERLSLPPKQIRKTLQFLQDEHLVKNEAINDLTEGGSQATKYWYIDYNHAVNTIRLRIYLLRKKLEKRELDARSSSIYLCPGYKTKECNGRYTEIEANQVVHPETGMFLCRECVMANEANPNPPPLISYTLQLVDNTAYLQEAMGLIRRINVQFRAKMFGNQQLRAGIYDLIQKVRSKTTEPLTSNLPSENRDQNIGPARVEGTGRTANTRQKKLGKGGRIQIADNDVTSLRNALGQHIVFRIEKGGSSRANLLAKGGGRSMSKQLDAAAIRVGVELDLVTELAMRHKRKREEEEKADEATKKMKREQSMKQLSFLRNNIGRNDEDEEARAQRLKMEAEERMYESDDEKFVAVVDSDDEWEEMNEDERRATFQAYYKKEMAVSGNADGTAGRTVSENEDDEGVAWEEG
jgi:transcription initiation factor IIE alpha subunit